MTVWLTSNVPTIIIALILLVLVFLAGRKVLRNKGGCSCGHCDGCDRCGIGSAEKEKKD